MEAILEVKTCVRCGGPYVFRLSRFGCVFSCPCGGFIDVLKAAVIFTEHLRSRRVSIGFVPWLSSSFYKLTSVFKTVVVELNFAADEFVAPLRNCTASDVAQLTSSLSLALQAGTRTAHATLAGPASLVDALVEELQDAAQDPQVPFLVSPPAPGLRNAVRTITAAPLHETLLDNIPVELQQTLKKHQREGVCRALQLRGRLLFADDMGVGKTLQALATVAALETYPLLILCPSAVKFMWADQIEQYLHEQVGVEEIHIIHGSNDALHRSAQPKVVLVSYHMAAVLEGQLLSRNWRCVVCDESHLLHTNASGTDATYTRAATSIGKRAPYCLLLSGTPALSSPFDMYNQVEVLRPGLLGASRFDFAMRYCHITLTPYLHVGESTRPTELASLLTSCCMLRRLKSEVLELPMKSRVVLRVADRPAASVLLHRSPADTAAYQERYNASWRLKWKGITEAVEHCCSKYVRVVLLAHHLELLDALMMLLRRLGKKAVRIDGRVPAAQRGGLLEMFHRGEASVAVVGITACAVGISFTPAQCAVFCELPPDAVWMRQAEDRLHRPGQTDEVVLYYLLGVHSEFDAELFARLCRAVREVDRIVSQDASGELSMSQVAHETHSMLPCHSSAQNGATTATTAALCEVQPTRDPLMFCVSKGTGRIHVRTRDSAALYLTFLWNEATDCVRDRQQPVWQQLDAFLTSLAGHSPFHRRQILLSNAWLPATFQWKPKRRDSHIRKHSRYAKSLLIGWGLWWQVRRLYFPTHYYFGPLTYADGAYRACCLYCARGLPEVDSEARALLPGKVCPVDGDVKLFCCGACRQAFYFKRSGAAIRRGILSVDKSICANCHVDCEALCTAVASAQGRQRRLDVVRRQHPQLLQFSVLCEKVITNPIPGNVWHADHIAPVAAGGGEASLENVQTLCTVCHALKTKEDVKHIKQYRAEQLLSPSSSPPPALLATTVGNAVLNWTRPRDSTRVSRRKVPHLL